MHTFHFCYWNEPKPGEDENKEIIKINCNSLHPFIAKKTIMLITVPTHDYLRLKRLFLSCNTKKINIRKEQLYYKNVKIPLGLRGTRPLVLMDMTGGSKTASSKD